MGFYLRADQPVGPEIKRIVLRQFELAAAELTAVGTSSGDAAVHKARRRVKKIRAVIRLVRPGLAGKYERMNRRLRQTMRLLGPIADGEGVVQSLDRLAASSQNGFSRPVFEAIRAGLVERQARADRQAKVEGVLPRVREALVAEHDIATAWGLNGGGFRAVAEGLEASYRRAKKSMALASERPTPENYHAFRRRVKDHWFHVRLIEVRCGSRLARYERALAQLDEDLGEYHNFALLRTILSSDPFVSRQETAGRLRVIRRYQHELRHRVLSLGARLYKEKPRQFVRRVHAYWRLTGVSRRPPGERPCRPRTFA